MLGPEGPGNNAAPGGGTDAITLTRRQFLANGVKLGAAAAVAPSALARDPVHEASLPGYKALVCVYLAGGNDAFNMLVPGDPSQYSDYEYQRGSLALPRNSLLMLPRPYGGRRFGLHPGMPELRELMSTGDALLVANVGAFEPAPGSGTSLPGNAYAHQVRIRGWQSCCSHDLAVTGWAGRVADLLESAACEDGICMNLSLGATNLLQVGQTGHAFIINLPRPRSADAPVSVDFDYLNEKLTRMALQSGRPDLQKLRQARWTRQAQQTGRAIDGIQPLVSSLARRFSPDSFTQKLQQVTRIIAAQDKMRSRRQIFFVSFHGWDHHHDLLANQATMLSTLSKGLASFRDALVDLGVFDTVTTFTASEFGRSLVPNGGGRGSDHGWAGHHIVMGGSVAGGRIAGRYPDLSPHSSDHVSDGVFAPTTSFEDYFAGLALWLGVPGAQIDYVFPNLAELRRARPRTMSHELFA
jgi:uncharacterized protein (DUF1501 family)